MSDNPNPLLEAIEKAISGKGAHVATAKIFEGLDWKTAGTRPPGAPHSAFELLGHLSYWQNWALEWLKGGSPKVPKHAAASWPATPAPASAREWQAAVRTFQRGLQQLSREARRRDILSTRGKYSRLGMIQAIASHNSHHAGQVVLLRQLLGKWPPPSGGVTW
jgi:uncharacterized damage-inducible protein DinB